MVTYLEGAVKSFGEGNYEGIMDGIKQLGLATKLVPDLIKNCKDVTTDMSQLINLSKVFVHPLTLTFRIGKALIVNGVDIYEKIF